MAIKASFSPGASLLSVFGDDLDNTITASRDSAGNMRSTKPTARCPPRGCSAARATTR